MAKAHKAPKAAKAAAAAAAPGPPKHFVALIFDEDCKMVGFEFRKFKDGNWEIRARRNLTGLTITAGGTDEGPYGPHKKYLKGVPEHPGPHGDADNGNNVQADVKKGNGKKRAHMTFLVHGNEDPCCQCGDELVCYD